MLFLLKKNLGWVGISLVLGEPTVRVRPVAQTDILSGTAARQTQLHMPQTPEPRSASRTARSLIGSNVMTVVEKFIVQ